MPGLPSVGHWELIALGVVLLLLFGPKHIPRVARSLGSGIREVREVASLDEPKRADGD